MIDLQTWVAGALVAACSGSLVWRWAPVAWKQRSRATLGLAAAPQAASGCGGCGGGTGCGACPGAGSAKPVAEAGPVAQPLRFVRRPPAA